MSQSTWLLLLAAGAIAGFIDSIAGGGGLITVPSLSVVMGPGVPAIATNKIAGTAASFAALLVYIKNGHVNLRGNRRFALIVALSSGLGSIAAPFFPPMFFKWFLIVACPLIIYVVWRKDIWVQHTLERKPILDSALLNHRNALWLAGFACGFYDGIAGPGGGTLMFLSLFMFGRLPLVAALGTSKLANFASASVSLASYSSQGLVRWDVGLVLGGAIMIGAFIGAELASRRAAPAARIALLVVSSLLLLRLLTM